MIRTSDSGVQVDTSKKAGNGRAIARRIRADHKNIGRRRWGIGRHHGGIRVDQGISAQIMEVYIKTVHFAIAIGIRSQNVARRVLSVRVAWPIAGISVFIGRGKANRGKPTLAERNVVAATPCAVLCGHDRHLHGYTLPTALSRPDGAQFLLMLQLDITCQLFVGRIKTTGRKQAHLRTVNRVDARARWRGGGLAADDSTDHVVVEDGSDGQVFLVGILGKGALRRRALVLRQWSP